MAALAPIASVIDIANKRSREKESNKILADCSRIDKIGMKRGERQKDK